MIESKPVVVVVVAKSLSAQPEGITYSKPHSIPINPTTSGHSAACAADTPTELRYNITFEYFVARRKAVATPSVCPATRLHVCRVYAPKHGHTMLYGQIQNNKTRICGYIQFWRIKFTLPHMLIAPMLLLLLLSLPLLSYFGIVRAALSLGVDGFYSVLAVAVLLPLTVACPIDL